MTVKKYISLFFLDIKVILITLKHMEKVVLLRNIYKRYGFTLIELLVVISIIALLTGILMPAMGKARQQVKLVKCMSNLRSIGQVLYTYASNNNDLLVPGDARQSWDVWGEAALSNDGDNSYRQVNLGHLLTSGELPVPINEKHVFFCPSGNDQGGEDASMNFVKGWGRDGTTAPIGYMFNNALDGFDDFIQEGQYSVLSHNNKINFLRGDGSVNTFKVKPLVYDESVGPELLQEVCARYGICFPAAMLHGWLEYGSVDLNEARDFLANPQLWMDNYSTGSDSEQILLSNHSTSSLVCDVVGVWGGSPRPDG